MVDFFVEVLNFGSSLGNLRVFGVDLRFEFLDVVGVLFEVLLVGLQDFAQSRDFVQLLVDLPLQLGFGVLDQLHRLLVLLVFSDEPVVGLEEHDLLARGLFVFADGHQLLVGNLQVAQLLLQGSDLGVFARDFVGQGL